MHACIHGPPSASVMLLMHGEHLFYTAVLQVRARAEELKRSLDQIILALELYADKVLW